ncbi:HAD hydrolase-like protein [Escherichia coli]|nr:MULTISPECIES: HAD hydrolase-like protein [Enterobacteriaceae]HCI8719797.1 HAD family hydrolase [Klebsiella variicola]HDS9301975.1 HAD family hydrolase [Klebsiella quasipneumoniae subsp. similipneumoniae]HDT6089695.1 HAD family hydrolase [Raoultella ornithinolytica]EIW8809526.1 HAD family hydrolase [Klebsiella pneumoniae]EMB5602182.1 HAD family hydrolase [Klebsiella pneumoniae]
MKKLLITDLDNTLYDWVSFYAQSFTAMLDELVVILGVPANVLIDEFRQVHIKHGNSEYPFGALELKSVQQKYAGESRDDIINALDGAFHAFNSARKKNLKCYDKVIETLSTLKEQGVIIVGHTEAPVRNAIFRLKFLGLIEFMKHLYTPKDRYYNDLDPKSKSWIESYGDFIFLLNEDEKKPNPRLLADICSREGFKPSDAIYIGDSLVKDISMANDAGVDSVYAEYGRQHDPKYWSTLVSITHWTKSDVERESRLKELYGHVVPTHSIKSFDELIEIVNF